jgi:integrase
MLTAKKVERTKAPGRYRDGLVKGLLLQISDSGAKSWILRYELHGRERMMGLGSAADFNLKEARDRARSARQLLADGVDPLATKRAAKAAAKAAAAKVLTFREAAQRYFDQHEKKWTNANHRDQFLASLRTYAFPLIGGMDVAAIQLADVLRVVEPHWNTKSITADRVRNRIEAVLDWAVVRGHRAPGTNPAKWRGYLDQVLPAARRVAPIIHHAAMDYRKVPSFMAALREREDSIAGRALEFLILTASRSGEVLGAKWDEIDLADATWTVPAHRMKAKREHRVPLSPAAVDLLRALPREDRNAFVFIGRRPGTGMAGTVMARLMQRMGCEGITIHGFRSSFRTWSAAETNFPREVCERALAHIIGSQTERAYERGDAFSKRRKLMDAWSRFVCTPAAHTGADVVPIGGRK